MLHRSKIVKVTMSSTFSTAWVGNLVPNRVKLFLKSNSYNNATAVPRNISSLNFIKVSQFQNVLFVSSFQTNANENFSRISALAYKKRLNQKRIKAHNFFSSFSIIYLRPFFESRAKIFKKNSWYFGRNDDTKRTFRN